MKKIIKWFSALLFVSVAIFLIFFLISINKEVDVVNKPVDKGEEPLLPKVEKTWLEHFSKPQQKGYSYPVNEIYIQVNLKEKITKTITYKLSAKLKDPYQLFCLKEELKRHKLKYFLKKDNRGIDLFIYSQNVDKLKNLVQVLKDYKIKAQLKPYNEEN